MRHDGTMTCTEQEALFHHTVRQGGRKEAQMTGRGGSEVELGEGLPGLQGTVGDSNIVQIYGLGSDGGGQRLGGSGRQSEEG